MNLGKKLRALREEKGLTQTDLGKLLQLTKSNISKYELGQLEPSIETINFLAKFFGVSVDYLLGRTTYRDLPQNAYPMGETTLVPVVGVIRAGEPIVAEENIIGYEIVEKDTVKNGDYFYLRVSGDSMIGARIQEGDLVLIKRQEDVDDGQIAVVLLNNEEATLKRVFRQNGQLILQAENPKYPPRVIKRGNVKILGKVVEIRISFE